MKLLERLSSLAGNRPLLRFTFWLTVVAVVLTAIHVHRAAAMTLPVPSGDEAMFVWQAHAVEVSNSFVAPELDPKNPILLLPLTYVSALGVVFKIFGCSIEVARTFSLVTVLAGFAILALVVRRMMAPRIALLLLGAVMLNARFVVMANAVRMEPLFLVVLGLSILFMQRGQIWIALAVLSTSPMIHPNGVLYLGAAVVYAVLVHGLHRQRPGRPGVVLLGLSAVLWLAHCFYVVRYWDAFVHDCAHRVGQMAASGKVGLSQLGLGPLLGLGLIGFTGAIARWRRVSVGYLLVFAVGAWLHSHLRLEEPYEPFRDLAYLLVALALLEILLSAIASASSSTLRLSQPIAAGFLGVVLLAHFYLTGRIEGPNGYFKDLSVSGMHIDRNGDYFTDQDRRVLQAFLNTIEPGRSITVEVYPWSDGLLIADLKDTRIHYQVPYFDVLFRPLNEWVWGYGPAPAIVPDLYIVRTSRHTAPHLRYRPDAMLARALAQPEVGQPTIIHSRDNTEIWSALRVTRKAVPATGSLRP